MLSLPISPFLIPPLLVLLYFLSKVYIIVVRPALSPITRLPGPKRHNFLWGCNRFVVSSRPGDWHGAMLEQYGNTFAYKGFMNSNRLCTVDPEATKHVLTKTDIYQKPMQVKRGLGRILGTGLVFSEGNEHRRQRKMMNPSFSINVIRSHLPTFYSKAQQVKDIWLSTPPTFVPSDMGEKPKVIVNVLDTMSRMALDIIGLTGFGYPFDALLDIGKEAYGSYGNELAQCFALALNQENYGFWEIIINWFPILYWIPTASEKIIEDANATLKRVGGELVDKKKSDILAELSPSPIQPSEKPAPIIVEKDNVKGKDFLSILIRANMASDLKPSERMSDEDVLSQIATMVITGHETTSTSLTWTLYTLASHPQVQERLREECMSVGSDEPSFEILEGLSYMNAVVRESLRFHAAVPSCLRVALKDDVIPLEGGKTVRIQKGDGVFIPIVALNKKKDVWGPDADEFNPDRWLTPFPPELRERQKQTPGVYSDLLTFIGGPRSCIGVKFSVVEMKCVLFTLMRTCRFISPPGQEITQRTTIVTRPLIKGKESEGNKLPLIVEAVHQ